MSKNFCCVTWKSLSKELAAFKHGEIADFVNKKGLPASMFAPVVEVLDTMQNVCPCCGSKLNAAAQIPTGPTIEYVIAPAPPKVLVTGKCRVCFGYGTLTRKPRELEDEVNCTNCHGTGMINNDTIKEHKISPEKLAQLDALEAKIAKEQVGKKIDVSYHEEVE